MAIWTINDVLSPQLPKAIKEAQNRAINSPVLMDELSDLSLRFLQVLISFTPLDRLTDMMYLKRSRAAAILKVSSRTITRHLLLLEEANLIHRLPQQSFGKDRWGCVRFHWSKESLLLLFPNHYQENKPSNPPSPPPAEILEGSSNLCPTSAPKKFTSCETLPAHKTSVVIQHETKDKLTAALSPPTSGITPSTPGVPLSLRKDMLQFQLNHRQLCFLMSQCKKAGQQLQTLFECFRDYLQKKALQGDALVGFFVHCLRTGQDFSWRRKAQITEQKQSAKAQKQESLLNRIGNHLSQHPNTPLPDGYTLLEVKGAVACLQNPKAPEYQSHSAIPIRTLAKELASRHPFWTKRFLQGKLPRHSPNHASSDRPNKLKEATAESRQKALAGLLAAKRVLRGLAAYQNPLSFSNGNRLVPIL